MSCGWTARVSCSSTASCPVAVVSKQVGYASSSHFISEFGRRFGATPRAYQDVQARQRLARVAVVGA
jgi:AraC-like DNA-binding protein